MRYEGDNSIYPSKLVIIVLILVMDTSNNEIIVEIITQIHTNPVAVQGTKRGQKT